MQRNQQHTPADAPADAIVLTLRRGANIGAWAARGVEARETRWLRALAETYPRVVLVSGGDASETHAATALARTTGVFVVSSAAADSVLGESATLAARVARLLDGATSAIVQSTHVDDAGHAQRIATGLRPLGIRTAHVVRAANLPSKRFAAAGQPHAPHAVEAGLIEAQAFRDAQMVIGVARTLCDDLAWRYGVNPDRTRVVPNYVSIDDDAPIVPVADRPEHALVTVGSLIDAHHHDVLIDAVAALPASTRNAITFTIVGSGPRKAALTQQAADAGVNLRFVSGIPYCDLLALLGTASLYLHACPYGPQPRPILEAMALGTPVVACTTATTPDILANGITGIAVDNNPEAFANALVGMLPDREWREMLGSGASVRIRKMCSIAQVLRQTIDAHQDALSGEARRLAA